MSSAPGHSPLPPWAATGRIRFARWDGGALETAKGILSGWYYLSDPGSIEATTNWYADGRSLELALSAGLNCLWVTFTNGFSLATEQPQQRQLGAFIARCHEHGIHVIAYASMVNVFIGDLRANEPGCDAWLQRTAQGQPVAYGAARYVGAPTRLLACLNHPSWREYLVARVRRACEAGADGMCYDNHWTECRCPRCEEKWRLFQSRFPGERLPWPEDPSAGWLPAEERLRLSCVYHRFQLSEYEEIFALTRDTARAYRSDFLVFGNFNGGYAAFTLPPNNAISTEDGQEPGLLPGRIVHNIGLLRSLAGAAAGWRPVFVEYASDRHMGRLAEAIASGGVGATRFTPMQPAKHQLAIAEAAAHGAALEITPEGLFLRDLHRRLPDAMRNWEAITAYHTFLRSHEELYSGVHTATGILSVHGSGCYRFQAAGYPQRLELLRELATRGVLFDVAFLDDLTVELLSRYHVALLADILAMGDDAVGLLRAFAERGGLCIATGITGWYDADYRRRSANPVAGLRGVRWEREPSRKAHDPAGQIGIEDSLDAGPEEDLDPALVDALAGVLEQASPPAVRVSAPPAVLSNVTVDSRGRLIVHLLNYGDQPVAELTVLSGAGRRPFASAEWFSPDAGSGGAAIEGSRSACVHGLQCYGVLRLTLGGRAGSASPGAEEVRRPDQ